MSTHDSVETPLPDKPQVGGATKRIESTSQQPLQSRYIEEDIEPTLGWRTWVVYASCCVLAFGTNYAISATGFWLAYVIPVLGSPALGIWFAEGGLVLQVALTPLMGQLSDFGSPTRRVLVCMLSVLGSIGLFVAGSAKDMHIGILGVCLYGFSIISYFTQFAVVGEVIPHRMRGLAQGSLYGILGMGGLVNNLGGGAIIAANPTHGWRWNLYISAGIQLVGVVLLLIFYRPRRRPNPDEGTYLHRVLHGIDWVGNALWICAFVPFMMGLIWGGNKYAWSSGPVIACLVVGAVFGVLCGLHQTFIKKDGIYHHGLFKHRNFALAVVGIFIEGIVYVTMNIFTPQQTGTLYESRPVLLGLHFSVLLIFASVSASACGYYSKKFRRVRELLVIGYLGIGGACIGFALCGPNKSDNKLSYAMFALTGFFFGPPQGLLLAVAQLAVDPEFSGLASAHIIGIRSMGGTIGAAIASAIFTAKIGPSLPARIASAAIAAGVPEANVTAVVAAVAAAGGAPVTLPGITDAQIAAAQEGRLSAFAYSFGFVFWSILPWAIVASISLAFLGSVREQMNWKIDAPIESAEALGLAPKRDEEAPVKVES